MIEYIIIAGVVFFALFYIIRSTLKRYRSSGGCSGSSCKCAHAKLPKKKPTSS